jgi:hypothetical protein
VSAVTHFCAGCVCSYHITLYVCVHGAGSVEVSRVLQLIALNLSIQLCIPCMAVWKTGLTRQAGIQVSLVYDNVIYMLSCTLTSHILLRDCV